MISLYPRLENRLLRLWRRIAERYLFPWKTDRVQDLFGLWASGAISCDTEYLTVQPELFIPNVAFAGKRDVLRGWGTLVHARPGTDPSETFSIREYLPGDPIRQIHWKLSQKNDTTMLRELGLPVAEETLLLLDTSASDDGLDAEAMDASHGNHSLPLQRAGKRRDLTQRWLEKPGTR